MAEHLRLSRSSRIFVAGHRGLVGSAIVRRLEALGCRNVLVRSHSELDLCEQAVVDEFFRAHRPEFVLSEVGASTNQRGIPVDRSPGNDKRKLCHRKDRRTQACCCLSCPIWILHDQPHADEPLRSWRQLRSGIFARPSGHDSSVP